MYIIMQCTYLYRFTLWRLAGAFSNLFIYIFGYSLLLTSVDHQVVLLTEQLQIINVVLHIPDVV